MKVKVSKNEIMLAFAYHYGEVRIPQEVLDVLMKEMPDEIEMEAKPHEENCLYCPHKKPDYTNIMKGYCLGEKDCTFPDDNHDWHPKG